MWSYYASKSKIVNYYPAPKFNRIIEPFAGTARYSLKYWQHDILLVDKYAVVVELWQWLQRCSEQDILSLPDLNDGDTLNSFDLLPVEKNLIGFCINKGSAQPKVTASRFNGWSDFRASIAAQLFKIRQWDIRLGDYHDIPNQEATWFIDPPYQVNGKWYVHNNSKIDYAELGEWCKSRLGQVIVCENSSANWLPFTPLVQHTGAFSTSTEAIWCNDFQQLGLF